jgi:hypothetical protein
MLPPSPCRLRPAPLLHARGRRGHIRALPLSPYASATGSPERDDRRVGVKHQPRQNCQASPETGHRGCRPGREDLLYEFKAARFARRGGTGCGRPQAAVLAGPPTGPRGLPLASTRTVPPEPLTTPGRPARRDRDGRRDRAAEPARAFRAPRPSYGVHVNSGHRGGRGSQGVAVEAGRSTAGGAHRCCTASYGRGSILACRDASPVRRRAVARHSGGTRGDVRCPFASIWSALFGSALATPGRVRSPELFIK